MDMGDGTFRQIKELEGLRATEEQKKRVLERHTSLESLGLNIFQVGEVVTVKGSTFKVTAIGSKFMKLRLLPWKDK